MPTMPNRIEELIASVGQGGQVDQDALRRVASLQPLDLVNLGRQFVEDQEIRDREFDDAL